MKKFFLPDTLPRFEVAVVEVSPEGVAYWEVGVKSLQAVHMLEMSLEYWCCLDWEFLVQNAVIGQQVFRVQSVGEGEVSNRL